MGREGGADGRRMIPSKQALQSELIFGWPRVVQTSPSQSIHMDII